MPGDIASEAVLDARGRNARWQHSGPFLDYPADQKASRVLI